MTNTAALKSKIDECGLRIDFICAKMGITYATFRRKLNNQSEFTASEITCLADLLSLTEAERDQIFFASEVN